MRGVSIILVFFTLIACNKVDKGTIIPLTELYKMRLYRDLDSLPKDLNQIYRLDLSEKELTKIPDIVYKMTNLQELNISNNQISEITKIAQLEKLQILNIGMNRISFLFCSL